MRGSDLRRVTRALSARHATSGWVDVFYGVYAGALTIAISVATVWYAAGTLLDPGAASTPALLLDPSWLVLLAALWFVTLLAAVVSRLGPVALSRAQAAWWLPVPVERRTLLRPAAWGWLTISGAVTAAAGVALVGGLGGTRRAVVAAALAGGGLGVLVVAALAADQAAGKSRQSRWTDMPILGVALLGVVAAAAGLPPLPIPRTGPTVLAAGVLVVAGAALWWYADHRLELIHDVDLRRLGSTQELAQDAAIQLNARELGRALERPGRRSRRVRNRTFGWVAGPFAALVAADAAALARSGRHLAQLVIGLVVAFLAIAMRDFRPLVVIPAVLAGGYLAASATAEGARAAQRTPALDRVLPLGARMTRLARLVVPVAVTVPVAAVLGALLGWRLGDVGEWVLLAVVGVPAWAAVAVRAAYRPDPTMTGLLVVTPMGAFPADLGKDFVVGPDLAVTGLVPLWIALAAQQASGQLILLQASLSAVALLVASRLPSR